MSTLAYFPDDGIVSFDTGLKLGVHAGDEISVSHCDVLHVIDMLKEHKLTLRRQEKYITFYDIVPIDESKNEPI